MPNDSVLSLKDITKTYPGVVALDGVSLDFRAGEVHALLGENGAGKSTLIKVIAGAVTPDLGSVCFGGKQYGALTPHEARLNGVEVIYQEFNLVGPLSAAENICLGERTGTFVDRGAMRARAREIFDRFNIDIDPDTLVRDLPSSRQQIVEIAKAVSRKARILVMDEPSAPLSVAEVESMFRIVRDFRTAGVCVIYISHRIDELFEISDRVTVMRDGRVVSTLKTADTNRRELVDLMVGRELRESYPAGTRSGGKAMLELRGVCGAGDEDISLTLRSGEILGIAGLVGAGRTELAKVIFGAEPLEAGEIFVEGQRVSPKSPKDAIRAGIGLIPENRKEEGCFLDMSVKWNIAFASLKSLSRRWIVDRKKEEGQAMSFKNSLRIRTPSLDQAVKNLSGGNQQKVVLAKVLATESRILIFDEPTRGIDVGARQEIYRLMRDLAETGKAIMMITSDMEELLGMSDRIAVLYEGRLAGILEKSAFSQRRVLELASGIGEQDSTEVTA